MRIALAGNPNSGKTTMFNALTGKNEKTGNWAGVTVSKKEGSLKAKYAKEEVTIVDLPGAYSMSAFTNEESITSDFVRNEKADVIINIVDGTNLSRSLFFTTQLIELGIPVVVALNKTDLNRKYNTKIDLKKLSSALKVEVVETVSTKDEGLSSLIEVAINASKKEQVVPFNFKSKSLSEKDVKEADKKRFDFVSKIVSEVEVRKVKTSDYSFNDRIDSILTNKWLGLPIFAVVMFLVFYISQTAVGPFIADFITGYIDQFKEFVATSLESGNPFLVGLLTEGIIGGVGAVIGFLPLVMVMYFLIALLEDCGYMARASVVLDPIFKRVGLSGKSVIPLVIGTGCAIPGIMACRTIKNERERRATAMLTPFMPCGAKLPVIALITAVFFGNSSIVGTMMYFVGIFLVFLGALLVKHVTKAKYRKSFFIMELPEYKLPSLKEATISMLNRGKAYIIKAGTIILVCNAIVYVMQSFTWSLTLVEKGMEHTSILASISSPIAFILVPLGFGVWQLAAASIAGFIAKENVVGTIGVVYGLTKFIDVENFELIGGASEVASTLGLTSVAALAFLMFNLFTPPCFAAIGAMNSEMQDKKWLAAGVGLQFATGYVVSFAVYQIGTLITTGSFGSGFTLGLIIVTLIILGVIFVSNNIIKSEREVRC